MSGRIALSDLLANVAAELRVMIARCHALEDGALGAMRQPADLSDGALIRFQHLDHLAQGLTDLARLAEAGGEAGGGAGADASAGDPWTSGWVERDRIRTVLTMTSLADRLLGEARAVEVEQGSDFLL